MAVVQTSYPLNIPAGFAGHIVEGTLDFILSRTVEGNSAVGFGLVALQGAGDYGFVTPGAALTYTATAAAKAGGNTGNGALALDPTTPILAGAKMGVYQARAISVAANAATFQLIDPDGFALGNASFNGSGASLAFSNKLKFTITDGSTDFALGDGFDITVAAPTAARFLGVTVRDLSVDPANPNAYQPKATAAILAKGVIWVTAGEAVAAGDAAYYNPATGAFLKSAGATPTPNVAIPRAHFETSAASGALVQLRLQ